MNIKKNASCIEVRPIWENEAPLRIADAKKHSEYFAEYYDVDDEEKRNPDVYDIADRKPPITIEWTKPCYYGYCSGWRSL